MVCWVLLILLLVVGCQVSLAAAGKPFEEQVLLAEELEEEQEVAVGLESDSQLATLLS